MKNPAYVLRSVQGASFTLFNLEGTPAILASGVWYGGLAQLGERLPCKQEVSGSIPLISTTFKRLTEIAVKTEISLSLLKGLCDAP